MPISMLFASRKFRVGAAIFSFLLIAVPSTFSVWWYMFTSTPPYQWLSQRGFPVMTVSPLWLAIAPIGIGLALLFLILRSFKAPVVTKPKSSPHFKIKCDRNIEGCITTNIWRDVSGNGLPVRFLHIAISTDCPSVANCKAFLTRIEKDGKARWIGQEQLTFSPSEAADTLAKTLHNKITSFVDVVVITSAKEILVCTKDRQWFHLPRLHAIFSEYGDYVLTVVVTGDGALSETALLKFNWTGNWQTSWLSLQSKDQEVYEALRQPLRPIEIRDALDDFIRQGEPLLGRWSPHNDAQLSADVSAQSLHWLAAVTEFTKRHLDVQHVDKLADYNGTLEAGERWKIAFNLARLEMDPKNHPIPYELGFKIRILKHFRDEIH